MQEAGVSGVVSSFYTYAIATVIAGVLFSKKRRGLFEQPKSIICLSLVAGWTNLSYVLAVIDGEVMRVMLLFYLSPLWTLILAHFWLKERTDFKGVAVIIISLLGAFIMLYRPDQQYYLPLPSSRSDWLALSSGIGFALTNVITRKSVHLTIYAKSFAVWLGVVVVALCCLPLVKSSFPSPAFFGFDQWLIMLLIALVLVLGTLLVQYGVTQITATRASVIFLFELVVAALASYFLAGEVMRINEWIGGAMIVMAAVFAASQQNSA